MRLVAITILIACLSLARSQKSESLAKAFEIAPPPVKLDKNLRQALLKALTELEAESVEHRKDEDEKSLIMTVEKSFEEVTKKNLNKNIGVIPKASFSFDGFPGDEEIPNEEKLQNSSFLESKRYVSSSPSAMIEKASHDDTRSFHVQNVVLPNKSTTPQTVSKTDPLETKTPKTSAVLPTVSKVESITLKPITQISESLTQSASNGITGTNGLIVPKPTASSLTIPLKNNVTSSSIANKETAQAEEVKIFQAPLVAAFTVQQDELGVPKSIVPIYRQSGNGEALTLQEQLEFRQKLLEKQLAELHQQQIQQTQFLVRQRQLYDQQLRQKQQQLYLQEQARIKQLEEQNKIKQLEEQRIYRLHQINRFPVLQKPHIFEQSNVLSFQPPLESTVLFQPSVSLEVPSVATPPLFRNYQEQIHFSQFRQQPQHSQQLQHPSQPQHLPQPQHLQQPQHPPQPQPPPQPQHSQQPQQPQPQQQRLQQNFVSFPTDFQPPVAPATRFNRQEAFNAVGNFGFNLDNKQPPSSRNAFNFNAAPRNPNTIQQPFVYNPYLQFRQIPTRAQTPAKQIQRLIYQSGVAGELGNVQGPGDEDLNIVSKVLALNVGALPGKNYQFITNNRGKLGSA
ncbi:RNA polymerase II degradation factor 1 [Monomorium pharaonis]|uniref:RNA polymerase II degradation factor 1 n=1 Tax=Monomorium pharaonis TaxID=307658 RepID=UPI00063F6331|nr:RNA polymerase II degradation factor 1 [Monomorium pharaonis]